MIILIYNKWRDINNVNEYIYAFCKWRNIFTVCGGLLYRLKYGINIRRNKRRGERKNYSK